MAMMPMDKDILIYLRSQLITVSSTGTAGASASGVTVYNNGFFVLVPALTVNAGTYNYNYTSDYNYKYVKLATFTNTQIDSLFKSAVNAASAAIHTALSMGYAICYQGGSPATLIGSHSLEFRKTGANEWALTSTLLRSAQGSSETSITLPGNRTLIHCGFISPSYTNLKWQED